MVGKSLQPDTLEELMSRPLHRNRRWLTSTVLGLWVFALFVGIANGCTWDGVTSTTHPPTVDAHSAGSADDHDTAPGCIEFCGNDVPLVSVLKLVQDHPAGQPLAVASRHYLGILPISAPALCMAHNAHPPPGVPFSLRTVRLTL
jgi:hypothetical protein